MMMSIALRFIPILIEETDIIMKAQMARGADFENGNLVHKTCQKYGAVISAIICQCIPAEQIDLAMAMEARCYIGGEGRTKMKPLHYQSRDYLAYLFLIVYFAGIILLRIFLA